MKRICLYGELDPYSSLIPSNKKGFKLLIHDLKIACLLYDQVITGANVLIEHPLTLPAFEYMKPFVEDGILWTSGNSSIISPSGFIENKLDKFSSNLLITDRKHDEILERWKKISPKKWYLVRNKFSQMEKATENILEDVEPHINREHINKKIFDNIIGIIKSMNEDKSFNRDLLLAKIGFSRKNMDKDNFRNLVFITQASFIRQGTQNDKKVPIKLFSGKFMERLYLSKKLFNLNNLPFDVETPLKISDALGMFGYSLKYLASWNVHDLHRLSTSKEWKTWRNKILTVGINYNGIYEIKKILNTHLLRSNDEFRHNENDFYFILPNKWITSGQTLVGSVDKENNKKYVLDLDKSIVSHDKQVLPLTQWQIQILTALKKYPKGINKSYIYQLEREALSLKNSELKNTYPKWEKDFNRDLERKNSQITRIDTQKNRLNIKLKNINLEIKIPTDKKGTWVLFRKDRKKFNISVVGTGWDQITISKEDFAEAPCKLSPQLLKVWKILSRNPDYFLGANYLSDKLDKSYSQKQISDIIYRLQSSLQITRYRIKRSRKGDYKLILLTHNKRPD